MEEVGAFKSLKKAYSVQNSFDNQDFCITIVDNRDGLSTDKINLIRSKLEKLNKSQAKIHDLSGFQ